MSCSVTAAGYSPPWFSHSNIFGSSEMIRTYPQVVGFVAIMLALYGTANLFECCYRQWVSVFKMPELTEKINRMIFEKAVNVDISCFEDSDFYNTYTKASQDAVTRVVGVFENATRMVGACLSSVYVVAVMFSLNLWIGLLSMLPIIVSYTLGRLQNTLSYQRQMEIVPYQRQMDYVNRAFFLQKYAKEIRLSKAAAVLNRLLAEGSDGIIRIARKYAVKLSWVTAINTSLCFPILFEGTWLLGAYLVMVQGALTISEYVVVATAAVSTTWMVRGCTQSLLAIMENALYIENIETFMSYKGKVAAYTDGLPAPERIETLELRDVSFRYKPELPDVLSDINLCLREGELLTLVGHNGSGKSTLVKLIMRLYDCTGGVILLNGVDIKKYDLSEYRRLIGATFQDFQLFSLPVTDNVHMGNKVVGERRRATLSALEKSGAYDRVMSLPDREDTILTREFDDKGALLSGGEAQKVAIARAFAKKSSILILDEPSSALDPFAENLVFTNFVKLCRERDPENGVHGKISIFISHRLSSAVIADRIVLLSEGRVAEEGTHEALMARHGAYEELFRKQAENYGSYESGEETPA